MSYTVIPARKMCNHCGNIQNMEAKHCSACGKSFILGQPDAWSSEPLQEKIDNGFKLGKEKIDKLKKDLEDTIYPKIQENNRKYSSFRQKCVHEYTKPGTVTSISCPCPKCSPSC